MDFSSFPHRQVVLRIKTTMVLTRVCSLDLLPCEVATLSTSLPYCVWSFKRLSPANMRIVAPSVALRVEMCHWDLGKI